MNPPFKIRAAQASDEGVVCTLLEAAALPHEDIHAERLTGFLLAVASDGEDVGVIGCEPYGAAALLRSLTVSARTRGQGVGERLVRRLEDDARSLGVTDLFLLTTTAEQFFVRLGYRQGERDSVPAAIAATTEFSSLCPDSAVCMTKSLRD